MATIKIVAFDPALSNLGCARFNYDWNTEELTLDALKLVHTEPTKEKRVRKNSDDLERASIIRAGMNDWCKGAALAIAEIPGGAQDARAAMAFGIVIGVLASCPLPLVQVTPKEAKMASVGIPTATKDEMIEWATAKFPHPDWLTRKLKGETVFTKNNEHLADACGIALAGIATPQFREAVAMFRAIKG